MTGERSTAICVAVVVLLAACVLPLRAAPDDKAAKPDPKAAPKAAPKAPVKTAPERDNTVVVTAVTGLAQRRVVSDAKAKWEKVKVGDVLSELTVIRTGLGSKVVIRMGDRSEVTIKSATKVGIKEFSKKDKVVRMRLGMKYGAMSARVDASRGANDFRVATPVATLSVRGSIAGWGFFGDRMVLGAYSRKSDWHIDYGDGELRTIGPREWLGPDGLRSSNYQDQMRDPGTGDPFGGKGDPGTGPGQTTGGPPVDGFTIVAPDNSPPSIHPPTPPPG